MTHIFVNDTVRLNVRFVDIDQSGNETAVNPISVLTTVTNSNNVIIISAIPIAISLSEYYYDFIPLVADNYKISFVGLLANNTSITINQHIYVSSPTVDYKPTISLKEDENHLVGDSKKQRKKRIN